MKVGFVFNCEMNRSVILVVLLHQNPKKCNRWKAISRLCWYLQEYGIFEVKRIVLKNWSQLVKLWYFVAPSWNARTGNVPFFLCGQNLCVYGWDKTWLLHHDNASAHSGFNSEQFLAKNFMSYPTPPLFTQFNTTLFFFFLKIKFEKPSFWHHWKNSKRIRWWLTPLLK